MNLDAVNCLSRRQSRRHSLQPRRHLAAEDEILRLHAISGAVREIIACLRMECSRFFPEEGPVCGCQDYFLDPSKDKRVPSQQSRIRLAWLVRNSPDTIPSAAHTRAEMGSRRNYDMVFHHFDAIPEK